MSEIANSIQDAADIDCDVLIVGGGMVGLTLGVALAGAGVETVIVDREDPATVQSAPYDGRSSAIARGSQQALAALGLWNGMAPGAEPILDIRVSDGRPGRLGGVGEASSLFLHYDSRETDGLPMGHIIENRAIRRASHAFLPSLPALTLLAPATLAEVTREASGVRARLSSRRTEGRSITARLLVAADGRGSPLRQAAGIGVRRWDYPQCGIVATVGHELPHEGVAHEHFLPSGPFALLPMTDAAGTAGETVHRSSLVWTERRELAADIMALDDDSFGREMERRFGDSLGRLTCRGRRWSYPLSLLHAETYITERLALVGDAAHAIHPIAGQGLNLGLRDAAALAEVLVDARRLGLDIGNQDVLGRYQRWRRFDNTAMVAATDALNRLFSNDLPPLRLARDLGMAAVNRLPPLKRFFMDHAMGLVGDLPRLIKGEAL